MPADQDETPPRSSPDGFGPSRANPLGGSRLDTKADLRAAVEALYRPLVDHRSAGGADVRLGSFAAVYPHRVAELEGFTRPLYGLVPLAIGGGTVPWDQLAAGLAAGTDPQAPDYWGPVPGPRDQRMVEQAAIGLALAFCAEHLWDDLDGRARDNLVTWLRGSLDHDLVDNNWQFFRVLVALGLERVGADFDRHAVLDSMRRIDRYRRGPHWYRDGDHGEFDYYVPWAFQTYGCFYVAANRLGLGDAGWAAELAERASGFAADFVHLFGPDGASIAYGRSAIYRFAAGSLWGALAWADLEAVPWPVAKGMALRHLRWWAEQPISDRDGVLSVGYAYDNRRIVEDYNSPGSPYWCMKYFAGLAAADDHPFWAGDEAPAPEPPTAPTVLTDPGWVVAGDRQQALLVPARQGPLSGAQQFPAKYAKFAYSSAFGWCVDGRTPMGVAPATDSMLTVTAVAPDGSAGVDHHGRVGSDAAGVDEAMVWSVWRPEPGVVVTSVVTATLPWHHRVHVVDTDHELDTLETGFALATSGGWPIDLDTGTALTGGGSPEADEQRGPTAQAASAAGTVAAHDCADQVADQVADRADEPATPPGAITVPPAPRHGVVVAPAPNAGLLAPHVVIAGLTARLPAGRWLLAGAFFAAPGESVERLEAPPLPHAAVDLALLRAPSASW